MKEWWLNLSLQEKQVVSLGVIAIGILLLYLLIWAPLQNSMISSRLKMQHDQALLTWMQATDKKIQFLGRSLKKPSEMRSVNSTLSTVQDALKQNSIAKNVTQLVQADNDSVKLNFQQVDFDLLITWLTELWQQQGFVVTQSTVTASNAPGMVAAELVLK